MAPLESRQERVSERGEREAETVDANSVGLEGWSSVSGLSATAGGGWGGLLHRSSSPDSQDLKGTKPSNQKAPKQRKMREDKVCKTSPEATACTQVI